MQLKLTTIALSVLALASYASAQDFTSNIGRVTGAVTPGNTVTIRWSVTNWPKKPIAAARHGIYLSQDTRITTADRLIRTVETPVLSWTQYSRDASWTVPNNLPRGTFYVGVIADHLRKVSESDEGNNVSTPPTRIFCDGRADLSIPYRTQTKTKIAQRERVNFSVNVQNLGGFIAAPCNLEAFLSFDSTINLSDRRVATVPVRLLYVGDSTTVTGSFTMPTDFRPGPFYLGFWVNRSRDAGVETKLDNNQRAYRMTCYRKGTFWRFGAGCRGTNGIPNHTARSSSTDPHPGTTATYSVTLGGRNQAGFLGIGLSRTSWGGLPLPRSMTAFGAPGCTLYTSLDFLVPIRTNGYGYASLPIQIPTSVPSGTTFYTQFFCGDQVNALGLTFSQVIETKLGTLR